MYSNEKSSNFNFRDIISKIVFLALFVLLLMWLFRVNVPNMKPFYSNVFRENIKYMQEAAKSYFTTDKFPKNVGETVEIKLQDMYAQKMILPFVDKDGNSCNVYRSYVSMTKNENDYTLKVNLSCNDEEDFIVETLGCYDYCEKDICTKKEEKITEYQFKKSSTKNITSCVCPNGFIPDGNRCLKTISNKVDATPVFSSGSQKVYDASVKIGETKNIEVSKIVTPGGTSYSCPSDYTPSSDKKNCSKTIAATVSTSTSYSCPSDYTPSSDKKSCTRTIAATKKTSTSTSCTTKKTTGTISSSSCTLVSGQWETDDCNTAGCPKRVWYNYYKCCTKTETISYSCPDNYTPSSDKKSCTRTIAATEKDTSTYSCPSNYTPSSDKKSCTRTIAATETITPTTYKCPTGTTSSTGSGASLKCYVARKDPDIYYCAVKDDLFVNKKCYHYEGGKFLYFKCPTGYNIDGTYCYKPSSESTEKVCKTETKTIYTYKWSKEKTLKGWIATGKTRTVKK